MRHLSPQHTLLVEGISAIADRYDGFILDVWGVLHNGVCPYPGVADALQRLKSAFKRVVLLSNAPIRAERVAARLEQIGVPRCLFQAVMSSGEEVWQNLRSRTDPLYESLGRRCLFIGSPRHRNMLEGLALIEVESPEEADFILNTGPDDLDDAATLYRPVLEAVLVDVEDTGIGLGHADEPRVFEPFYTTRDEGIGLGLAVSRELVSGMGGALEYRDDGTGATFVIHLPDGEAKK